MANLQKIKFLDKYRFSENIQQRTLSQQNINETKYIINSAIDFIENFKIGVTSVNSLSGNIIIDFPVKSVQGKYGNVIVTPKVTTVHDQIGNIILKISDLQNDLGFITSDVIPVSSINGLTGDVKFDFPVSSVNGRTGNVKFDFPVSSVNGYDKTILLKLSDLQNDSRFITSNSLPVSSINGLTGDVKFDFPVSFVNGMTGNVKFDFPVSSVNGYDKTILLKLSDLQNDLGFITSDVIPVSSVNGMTGDVKFDFPVSSVNGRTGNVKFDFPVSSVNGKTNIINLKISQVQNDSGYLIFNDLNIHTIQITNELINQSFLQNFVIFIPNKISQLENDSRFFNSINDIFSTASSNKKINFII